MTENWYGPQKSWTGIKETSAESVFQRVTLKPGESNRKDSSFRHYKTKQLAKSVFVTRKGDVVGGGTNTVLNALAAYLRYLEGTTRDDWQEYVVTFWFYTRIIKRAFEYLLNSACEGLFACKI